MPHSANKRTKRRCRYSKCIGKRGRTMKRKLYAYYKSMAKSISGKSGRTRKGKKKGG